MRFKVVSSGSKGNATLIYSKGHCIQVDFGISKRRIHDALESYDLSFDDIEAFLITHNHSDHCSNVFSADKNKVYAPLPTLPKLEGVIPTSRILIPGKDIQVGPFSIEIIPLSHDAKNTVGFVISDGIEKIGYITDTGFIPEKYFERLMNLDYYIFESNHDVRMLYESERPDYLIRRIISDNGHLSNVDSAFYLSVFIGDRTKEVVLAHLSNECNTPELALKTYHDVMIRQLGYVPDVQVFTASDKFVTEGGQ